jgi:hypothetical protein
MRLSDFENIVQHVREYNTYFATGFANAVKDATLNTVVLDGSKKTFVFPTDKAGDYFYLRNEQTVNYTRQEAQRLSDCKPIMPYSETMICYLVAVVKEAEPFQLLQNLRDTLANFGGASITFNNANWNREQIVRDEMSGSSPKDIEAALSRLKKQTIVKLSMNVATTYVPSKCTPSQICAPCPADA